MLQLSRPHLRVRWLCIGCRKAEQASLVFTAIPSRRGAERFGPACQACVRRQHALPRNKARARAIDSPKWLPDGSQKRRRDRGRRPFHDAIQSRRDHLIERIPLLDEQPPDLRTRDSIPPAHVLGSKHSPAGANAKAFREEMQRAGHDVSTKQAGQLLREVPSDSEDDTYPSHDEFIMRRLRG